MVLHTASPATAHHDNPSVPSPCAATTSGHRTTAHRRASTSRVVGGGAEGLACPSEACRSTGSGHCPDPLRRDNRSGLVVCARCGKHFVVTSAVGNRYLYRYYTCFTRQRYGTRYCDAVRLPAEELDAAILDALLHVYERTDLFDKAVAAARRRARQPRPGAGRRRGGDHQGRRRHRALPLGLRVRRAVRGPVRQASRRPRRQGAQPPGAA